MLRVAMLMDHDFQDDEFRQTYNALRQAGHEVTLVAPEANKVYRGRSLRERVTSDVSLDSARPEDFEVLVIPGGYAPDRLRVAPGIADFVGAFDHRGKPIAAIGHGLQLMISADIVRDRNVTGAPNVLVDLRNAGANLADQAVVMDRNFITARKPADLPQFCEAILHKLRGEERVGSSSQESEHRQRPGPEG